MKPFAVTLCLLGTALLTFATESYADNTKLDGEALFMKKCIACHANGGNQINPMKTLSRKDLEQNNISTPEAIVKLIRKPGPGMLTFNAKSLSDEEAKAIAEYVLSAFNK